MLALVILAVALPVRALTVHGTTEFNWWVGLANVAAFSTGAIGLALTVWDKFAERDHTRDLGLNETEIDLAAVVLQQAAATRSRLLGVDSAGDQAANVHFVKGTGRFREVGGISEGDLASILTYYQSLSPGRLVVLGSPGAGKTVLAYELLVQLLELRLDDKSGPAPVLISAASYDVRQTWAEWLARHLALRYAISIGTATKLVSRGRILPIVDGLDEMDPPGTPHRAHVLITALNDSMLGRDRAPVVVTCRRSEYQAFARHVDRATHVEMIPLSGDESAEYLRDQFLDEEERKRWEPVLADLQAHSDGLLAAQFGTPWRLIMGLVAYRNGGDPTDIIPPASTLNTIAERKYANQFDGMLLSRYVSSVVRRHDSAGRYTDQQVQQWLITIAHGLAWQGRYGGSATDIRLDQWWQSSGRLATRLFHSAVVALPVLPWVIVAASTSNFFLLEIAGGLLAVAVFVAPPYPKRLKLRGVFSRRGLLALIRGLILGARLGALVGLATALASALKFAYKSSSPYRTGFEFALEMTVGLGSVFWLEILCIPVCALIVMLAVGLVDSSPQAVEPKDTLRADGRYGIAVGIAVGSVAGITSGFTSGVMCGLTIGAGFGLGYGASAWTRYYASVVIMAARRNGPFRFAAFLAWAYQAGLLRISGVAYQFRHRQLQDWLTQLPANWQYLLNRSANKPDPFYAAPMAKSTRDNS